MNDALEQLIEQIFIFLPKLGAGFLIFAGFWLVALFSQRLIFRVSLRSRLNFDVANLIAKLVKISILVFGVVTALGTLGIDVAALVAGLGLTGFAVGLALKDILSNVIAGVLILIYKPFRRNDRISVSDFEGKVIGINLRYTTLEGKDKKILIPNASLFTNTICVLDSGTPNSPLPHHKTSLESDESESDFEPS